MPLFGGKVYHEDGAAHHVHMHKRIPNSNV